MRSQSCKAESVSVLKQKMASDNHTLLVTSAGAVDFTCFEYPSDLLCITTRKSVRVAFWTSRKGGTDGRTRRLQHR